MLYTAFTRALQHVTALCCLRFTLAFSNILKTSLSFLSPCNLILRLLHSNTSWAYLFLNPKQKKVHLLLLPHRENFLQTLPLPQHAFAISAIRGPVGARLALSIPGALEAGRGRGSGSTLHYTRSRKVRHFRLAGRWGLHYILTW